MTSIAAQFFSSNSDFHKNIVEIENDITKTLMSTASRSSKERPPNVPPVSMERPPNVPPVSMEQPLNISSVLTERPPNVPPVSTVNYRSPDVKWAQRVDKIYLTVLLTEAKNAKVNLIPDGVFTFSATAGTENHAYELKLDLFGKVNVEESKINMGTRSVFCIIKKAEEGWWKKLLRGDQKNPHYLKVDWDKWVDEDEDEDTSELDLGGMDFSNFGGMDGLGGMEEASDEDSSDEDEEVANQESKTEAVSST